MRGEVNTFISKRNADCEREEWPFGRAPEVNIPGFADYIEQHVVAKSSRRFVRLGVDRALWCLDHNFNESSLVALVLDAAKLRIWTRLFSSKLWAKEMQWTLDAALGMSHLICHSRDKTAFDDNAELRAKLTMIDDTCFKKVRKACQPHKDQREAERFKRDQNKLANFSTVPEFQAGLRASMSDFRPLHQKQEAFTQAEHERMLAVATGVNFIHAIADR